MCRKFAVVFVSCLGFVMAGCESGKSPAPVEAPESSDATDDLQQWAGVMVPFSIQSTPSGASVKLSSGERCKTPCTLQRPLLENFDITVEKSGFRSKTVSVVSHANVQPGSAATGKPKFSKPKLSPNPVTLTLDPAWDR